MRQFRSRLTLETSSVTRLRGEANPVWETVQAVARVLGVSVAELAKAAERLED